MFPGFQECNFIYSPQAEKWNEKISCTFYAQRNIKQRNVNVLMLLGNQVDGENLKAIYFFQFLHQCKPAKELNLAAYLPLPSLAYSTIGDPAHISSTLIMRR